MQLAAGQTAKLFNFVDRKLEMITPNLNHFPSKASCARPFRVFATRKRSAKSRLAPRIIEPAESPTHRLFFGRRKLMCLEVSFNKS